jgi:RHS repeat-associated protein
LNGGKKPEIKSQCPLGFRGLPTAVYAAELLSNGQVKLWRLSDWSQLGTYTISGFQANQQVTLGIRANGSTISVEVDGTTRISVTDGSFSSGEVGLWSYDPSSANQHVFDDFIVQNLGQGSVTRGKVVAAHKALAQPRMKTAARQGAMTKSAFTLTRQAGQVWTSYYYARAARVAMREVSDEGSEVYYILTDHLGSTSITVNDAGQRTAQVWYKPWGEVREVWGVLPTDRTFQGQIDPGWGLKHFGARWLDSSLGRFAQADSIIPGAGNPLAWDRYAGLGNNPVRYTDPSGHEVCDEEGNCYDNHTWRPAQGTRFSVEETWKKMIWTKYGIKMSKGDKDWDVGNYRLIYSSLNTINNALNGYLRNNILGAEFKLMNQDPAEGHYHGQTHLDGSGIDFYTLGNDPIRQMNIFHEVGHLLDNVPGLKDVFTLAVENEDNPSWVDEDKQINPNALKSEFITSDPNYNRVQARQTFNNFGPSEQWADAFANYVAGNINMDTGAGRDMYTFITGELTPYIGIP